MLACASWAPSVRLLSSQQLTIAARTTTPVASAARISRRNAVGLGAAAATLLPSLPAVAETASDVYVPLAGSGKGKTVLITGANTGLGLESAKRLAVAGATVIATARTEAKAAATLEQIKAAAPGAAVTALVLDLGSLESVKGFPARLEKAVGAGQPIDVLMNNAGVMAIPERLTTSDGYERQVGVNHLGHFALVSVLLPSLRRARDGFRVINVSSEGHRFATADAFRAALERDLDPQEYSQWGAYGLSKAANVLFAAELQRRLDAAGVAASAVSLHPGAVQTDLARYLVQGVADAEAGVPLQASYDSMNPLAKAALKGLSALVLTVEKGANTQVFLAVGADAGGNLARDGGLYFNDMKVATPESFTQDATLGKRLWDVSEKLTGLKIAF